MAVLKGFRATVANYSEAYTTDLAKFCRWLKIAILMKGEESESKGGG